jgi:two-component system response regulator AtoC
MARILVVDDEVEVLDMLKVFLSAKGYTVHTAQSGRAALELVKQVRPHIVLLDIIMPEMSGIDVLKKIKTMDPTIGVVMATAIKDEDLAKKAMKLGAYDYIAKPFDLDYLENVLMVKMADILG